MAFTRTVTDHLLGGLRRLRRAPLFTGTAVGVLALGVGALTGILVGTLACWLPAQRAEAVDPDVVLRPD